MAICINKIFFFTFLFIQLSIFSNAQNCTTWLKTPNTGSIHDGVTIGDLDVSGNQLTVEATFNSTDVSSVTGYNAALVSKHSMPSDCNFVLRTDVAQLTTQSNGLVTIFSPCDYVANKTYHVAMVYDGSTLKFYRNGFLMISAPQSGNMVLNNLLATIGNKAGGPTTEGLRGIINEVRIWNVARTQNQIQTYMNSSLPNPTTQPGLLAYYTFDNLLNKQGNAAWNGTFIGSASINVTNPNCTFVADSCGVTPINSACNFDFTFKQDVCNPLSVQFFNEGTTPTAPYWSFGDGTFSAGNLNPVHTFLSFGNYTIKYFQGGGACTDTLQKTMTVNLIQDDVILTKDTTICFGNSKQLITKPSLDFCWSPTTSLNDPNSPNPITTTINNIKYNINTKITGNNLIVNGDFSAGNSGFTSDYKYANPNITEGQYFVGPNPNAWNPTMSNCTDHTTGSGNMLLVNGAPAIDVEVWKETIAITPNTNYAFSTSVQALWFPNPAQLRFSINGINVGTLITASLPTCTWTSFYTTWNSGKNTIATISLVNKNTFVIGNDFALDDIVFAPVFIKTDSVSISVEKPKISANNDTSICYGNSFQLNAIGGVSYIWSPTTGLSNINIPNPTATPTTNTQYIVTGTTAAGCTAKDSVNVLIKPSPIVTKTSDTTLCHDKSIQLFASGGNSYSWQPTTGLSDPTLPNPIATPLINTNYYVTVTGSNFCQTKDSIKLTIISIPTFSISPNAAVCFGNAKQMNSSGGDIYTWIPSSGLSNPNIANPIATLQNTTTYQLKIISLACNDADTLSTTLSILPKPILNVSSANDIDCTIGQSQLTVSGAINYVWSPTNGLNNATIYNPIASPTLTTTYMVNGVDANGCTDSSSVVVNVSQNGKSGYEMPNAFTPNNDGLNDCFGIKYWGQINAIQFTIYDRYGKKMFYTENPSGCWDGTFNSQAQPSGNYIYYIKAKTVCGVAERKGSLLLIR